MDPISFLEKVNQILIKAEQAKGEEKTFSRAEVVLLLLESIKELAVKDKAEAWDNVLEVSTEAKAQDVIKTQDVIKIRVPSRHSFLKARTKLKMSQEEFAQLGNLDVQVYGNFERGMTMTPRKDNLVKLQKISLEVYKKHPQVYNECLRDYKTDVTVTQ